MTKRTPPFSLIEEIRYKEGQYRAYDTNGNFVIELAPEGAMELVQDYGIKSVGFSLSMLRGMLNAMGAFAVNGGLPTFQEMSDLLLKLKRKNDDV